MKSIYHGLSKTEEVLSWGAEALIVKTTFLGHPAVKKVRIPKPYRCRELDEFLRRRRTLLEAKLLHYSIKSGVPAPAVYAIDLAKTTIVIEFLEGELLKKVLEKKKVNNLANILEEAGYFAGCLHEAGIVHGDLTTSNIMVCNAKPVLIDFGLGAFSRDYEDQSVDLHLFLRSLESTHFSIAEDVFKHFIRGYEKARGKNKTEKILSNVKDIRMRGRYVSERRIKRKRGQITT
ncbi:MAG: Kae1-associated kinase Bud32 [Thermoprotei archaeon]|nr:MAG: Kae1-associated kinase Bud32 [Thermoprotei archaeon]RLF01054.1 MAG: Kae1-associated kinase Bud32 [Thermoprotei archaeon]HDI74314.1 Kae1-associated kinase Bud32 [Thermoprotei archaeon]